jgi:RNA-directed DNA polymerase
VSPRKETIASEANCNCGRATNRVKEAGSETVEREVSRGCGSDVAAGSEAEGAWSLLRQHWPRLREQPLVGRYRPSGEAAARPEGERWDAEAWHPDRGRPIHPAGSLAGPAADARPQHSHGFRPGHRAHDAIVEAQRYIEEGRRFVVDVDLEQFFDRVNHDVLMGKELEKRGMPSCATPTTATHTCDRDERASA